MKVVKLLLTAFAIFIIYSSMKQNSHEADSKILAFGDSLTYGYGVKQEFSYPAVLEKKINVKVINAGVCGETSHEGLARLEELLKLKPKLVILCHGANDVLQNYSKKQLKINLLKMVEMIKKTNAKILLVGVPNYKLSNVKILTLYKEVADETSIMYENSILSYIQRHKDLKSDDIHPNKAGYKMMAEKFMEIIEINKVQY